MLIEQRCQLVYKALIAIQQGGDSSYFEDFLRKVVGTQAYILFTFDKTLNLCGKQI